MAVVFYFYTIPQLHSVGTALLASAGVTSILFGLGAQTTLSTLVSGFALLFYQSSRWEIVCSSRCRPALRRG